jgi:hypothetical protein
MLDHAAIGSLIAAQLHIIRSIQASSYEHND